MYQGVHLLLLSFLSPRILQLLVLVDDNTHRRQYIIFGSPKLSSSSTGGFVLGVASLIELLDVSIRVFKVMSMGSEYEFTRIRAVRRLKWRASLYFEEMSEYQILDSEAKDFISDASFDGRSQQIKNNY